MKRTRTSVCCACWLLAAAATSPSWSLPAAAAAATATATSAVPAAHGLVRVRAAMRVDPLSVPRLLQTATLSNDTAVDGSSGSDTIDTEGRAAAAAVTAAIAPVAATPTTITPPNQVDSASLPPSSSAPTTDTRIVTDASNRRGSSLGIEGIIGIVAGVIAALVLAIAFVHAGSSKRKRAQQQQDEQEAALATADLASSTMSIKDVKYVDSFDSPVSTPRASIRKPSVPLCSQQLRNDDRLVSDRHAGPAPSLEYTIGSTEPEPEPEQLFTPSRVRTLSLSRSRLQSQQSASCRRESLQRPPSPEHSLEFAHSTSRNPFAQSRRSRQSRATSRDVLLYTDADTDMSSLHPLPTTRRPSRLRFSRSSMHSTDSASEIPMLDDHRSSNAAAPPLQLGCNADASATSPRDIPVLARGSEESVDSIEDEDIEISI